ncbi:MAG: hypothetical protein ACKPHU_30510, partial [Planctomycetaceae bacterium]
EEPQKAQSVGVMNRSLYFQLSQTYSLWHGCHGPLTPDPSPPFHGGEGRIVCSVASQASRDREGAGGGRVCCVGVTV